MNLDLRRNIYESNGKDVTPATNGAAENGENVNTSAETALKEPRIKFFCYSCGADCTRIRYHHAKITPANANVSTQGKVIGGPKIDLCTTCFGEGRYPSSTSREEFVQLEDETYAVIPDRDKPWSDSETLRLLEALEMHDEDWTEIANYIGTRTREQCVLKFLQLEIEDKYIDGEQGTNDSKSNLAWLSGGRVPFDASDNPVMSVISFLASTVEPTVAAAAAGRSVDEIRKTMRERLENDIQENTATNADPSTTAPADPTSTTEGTTTKAEDTMDIDVATTAAPPPAPTTSPHNPQTTALSLLATRSSALASHTERHVTSLLSSALALQTQKLDLKLAQFAELEKLLAAERRDVERRRRELFLERLAWRRRVEGVKDGVRKAVGAGLGRGDDEAVRVLGEALALCGVGEQIDVVRSQAQGVREALGLGHGQGQGQSGIGADDQVMSGADGGLGEGAGAQVQPLSMEMGQAEGFRSFEI